MYSRFHRHNIEVARWIMRAPSEFAFLSIVLTWLASIIGCLFVIDLILSDGWIKSGVIVITLTVYHHYLIKVFGDAKRMEDDLDFLLNRIEQQSNKH